MDSLPPLTTMPTSSSHHTPASLSNPSPTPSPNLKSRIPSIPENDELAISSPTATSPSPSPSPEDEDDLPLPSIPAIITADTIPHLTDLLNRPAVRHNEQKRAWVQAKLMDAQMEMKRQRRGRRQRSSLPFAGEA